ncbi:MULTISPECIES: hypothetical protein [unclassified Pannonibacter]|uniref:hypothetical protein n=1 Tax=unclassified Pannonibacter TaxID=2627228 RepID=UPI0016446552|nr:MULTISPECIES: hypothetical protein [unclassified Pannonibacter]
MTSTERQARRRRRVAEAPQRLKAAQPLLHEFEQMLEIMDRLVRHEVPDDTPVRDPLFDCKEGLEGLSMRLKRLLGE